MSGFWLENRSRVESGMIIAALLTEYTGKDLPMMPNTEIVSDAVRNNRHRFHQAEGRKKKSQKHRYERRKIKEILTLADWETELAS